MKTIDHYICREFALYFTVFIIGFVVVMLGNTLFLLSDLIYTRKIPIGIVSQIILLRAPANMVLGFPVATLFAAILSLGRLGRDSEVLAMWSGGVSGFRIIVPVLAMSLIVSVATFLLNDTVVPDANHRSQNYIRRFYLADIIESAKANVFFHVSDELVIYAGSLDGDSNQMGELTLFDIDRMGFPTLSVVGSGWFENDNIHLVDGLTFDFNNNGDSVASAKFDTIIRDISRELSDLPVVSYTPTEIETTKLRQIINSMRDNGIEPHGLVTDYYFKFSIPAASLIFGLLGVIFTSLSPRKETASGVIFAIICISIYWVLMTVMRSLGHDGIIPSWLASWGPNIFFFTAALPLFTVLRR